MKYDENEASRSVEKVSTQDEEVDPLDAFMSGLESQAGPSSTFSGVSKYEMEDDHDSHMETFAKERAKKNALVFTAGEVLEEQEYDSDDIPLAKKRVIESLTPLDHRSISYEPFNKVLFIESPSDGYMTEAEVAAARKALKIAVSGSSLPRLVTTFSGFHMSESLLKLISSTGFERPTPIQMQAVPVAMHGRDVLGIAATGSGKTLSFVWPMLMHVFEQRPLKSMESGPIGIIVAPTRELASQIYEEAKRFAKCFQRMKGDKMEKAIRVAPLMGGLGRGDTRLMLKSSPHEIVVATPGRLIDMLKTKLINTLRTTMLVLDEADKMFDMGFEPQLRSIVGQIRPDRQTLLFSATFKHSLENLARDILTNPVKITVGSSVGGANQDVTQVVEILNTDQDKWNWLAARLNDFVLDGSVLLFAGSKIAVEDLLKSLKQNFPELPSASLHGDKSADERTQIMQGFKTGKIKVLVATDLAARGLDVRSIRTVINFQRAKDIDAHTHRIGRTGRAGDKLGFAYSLLTPNESHFAGLLVKNLENAKQDVPPELLALAYRHPKFKHASHPSTSCPHRQALAPSRREIPFEFLASSSTPLVHQDTVRGVITDAPKVTTSESVKKPAQNPIEFVKCDQQLQTVNPNSNPPVTERYDPLASL